VLCANHSYNLNNSRRLYVSKLTSAKAIGSLVDDMNRVKKYVTRITSGNEY
jgi:predicted DNA repair protein MutK